MCKDGRHFIGSAREEEHLQCNVQTPGGALEMKDLIVQQDGTVKGVL